MNIDNNTVLDTTFPVLLTPTKPRDLLDPNQKNYFLDFLLNQKPFSNEITFYENVAFLLNSASFRIDGMFIDTILESVNRLMKSMEVDDPNAKRTIAQSLFYSTHEAKKLEQENEFESMFGWKTSEIQEGQGNIFIKNLTIHPLFLTLSFQLKKKEAQENVFFLFNLLTSALGTALANLDEAPIQLKGINLTNVFDTQDSIVSKIISKYKDEVGQIALKLVGSLDIVGNPVGLFGNISSGVSDLLEKPAKGFLNGPLEGGKGIVTGAGSLVKNTVSGTMNSLGKVTGSLATGLSSLAMDDEYLASREQAKMKRPKHLGEGIYQGVGSIGKGVFEGVTGIFTKPIEGAQKGGVGGFLKGTFKGITGAIVKPVTGVLDAASKTAEGVKNTATAFDQKAAEMRSRFPRAFYGKDKFFRTYIDSDAEILWYLHFLDQKKAHSMLKNVSLLSSFEVFPDEKNKDDVYILAISYESIVFWGSKKRNLVWYFDPKTIDSISTYPNGLQINLTNTPPSLKDKQIQVKNCDANLNQFIYKKIMELKNY